MNDEARPRCPECGAPMRPLGRGATLRRRGVRYICPVAEALPLAAWRHHTQHAYCRVWTPAELEASK